MVYHWMLYFSSEPKSLSWNPPDFMKSARFHHEICQISWIVDFLPLNPVFFIRTNTDIHERTRSTTECCIFGSFGSFQYRYMLNISPYHEICLISWNPSWNLPNFMKSAKFHEIHRNSADFMKFAEFHVFPKWAKDQWSYFFLSEHHYTESKFSLLSVIKPSFRKRMYSIE